MRKFYSAICSAKNIKNNPNGLSDFFIRILAVISIHGILFCLAERRGVDPQTVFAVPAAFKAEPFAGMNFSPINYLFFYLGSRGWILTSDLEFMRLARTNRLLHSAIESVPQAEFESALRRS